MNHNSNHSRMRRSLQSRQERGQSLLEFALVVPVLFLMLIGVAFVAQGFNLQIVLSGAAYEGARVWAKDPAGGDYIHCTPPACNSGAGNARNFEKYVMPVVRQYISNNGFDGQQVKFFAEDQRGFENAMSIIGNDPQYVRMVLLYPIQLPVGNFASNYQRVIVSASCTMRRGS